MNLLSMLMTAKIAIERAPWTAAIERNKDCYAQIVNEALFLEALGDDCEPEIGIDPLAALVLVINCLAIKHPLYLPVRSFIIDLQKQRKEAERAATP